MTLLLATVTDSISKLSVSGLTIKDIDEIPVRVYGRNCPILYLEPLDLMATLTVTKMTFGRGLTVKWMMHYDLNYTMLYAPIGSGRGLELLAPTIAKACLFFDVLMESHPITGAELVTPGGWSIPGPLMDPSGNSVSDAELFYGVKLTIHVAEQNG